MFCPKFGECKSSPFLARENLSFRIILKGGKVDKVKAKIATVDGAKIQRLTAKDFYVRTLARSGGTRYLSLGAILPKEWEVVKIYVEGQSPNSCLLRIVQLT